MRINNNLMAMNTHRQMGATSLAQSKSMEKLSSGLRINRASDDAAGLAISEKMRAQIRGLNQAARNVHDGISLIQTAEGAASSIGSMLTRMKELAVQASNSTYSTEDRQQIQAEITEITNEITSTAQSTEFNGIVVLDGGGTGPVSQASLDQLTAKLPEWIHDSLAAIRDQLGVALPDSPVKRNLTVEYYYNASTSTGASMGTGDGGASLTLRVNTAKVFDGGGSLQSAADTLIAHEFVHAMEFTEMPKFLDGVDNSKEQWFMEGLAVAIQGGNGFLPATKSSADVALTYPFDGDYGSAYAAVKTLHEITDGGINAIVDRLEAGDDLSAAINATTQSATGSEIGTVPNFTDIDSFINWFNTSGDVDTYLDNSTDFTQGTGAITNGSSKGSSSNLTLDATIANNGVTTLADTHFNVTFSNTTAVNGIKIQTGSEEGDNIELQLKSMKASDLGIDGLDFTTSAGALGAIAKIDEAIKQVSSDRGYFGAMQNRLEHTINNLSNYVENITSAESRIRDVDMAKEMMTLTKNNILQQASQAMLAQANQAAQGVLQLLR